MSLWNSTLWHLNFYYDLLLYARERWLYLHIFKTESLHYCPWDMDHLQKGIKASFFFKLKCKFLSQPKLCFLKYCSYFLIFGWNCRQNLDFSLLEGYGGEVRAVNLSKSLRPTWGTNFKTERGRSLLLVFSKLYISLTSQMRALGIKSICKIAPNPNSE